VTPENAQSTEAQDRPVEPEAAAEEPVVPQRTADNVDQKTVTLQVGAPEHARGGPREHANRQTRGSPAYGFSQGIGPSAAEGATRQMPQPPAGDQDGREAAPGFSPTTVRIGGHTPPERVPPAPSGTASGSDRVRPPRIPRRTSLQLQRLEPWSVLKLSLVLSIAGFLAWMVAVGVLYGVLDGMGVWDQLNGTISDLDRDVGTELISAGRVFGVAFVVGLVNIVLMTALATVGSLIYNIAADLVGGVEVTLSEPD
jgi:hypothetical protein